MKSLGASKKTLLELFKLYVRSKLETGVAVWAGSITVNEKNILERVQKTALKIILGNSYRDYNQALEYLNLDTLQIRREKKCLKFAKRSLKNYRFKHWFPKRTSKNTRYKETFIMPTKTKTKRYLTSSIPYMIGLLNRGISPTKS